MSSTWNRCTCSRACFPLAFLVNHSCVANSTYLWTKAAPFTATLLAARAIPAGEAITANYQPTVTCSLLRWPPSHIMGCPGNGS